MTKFLYSVSRIYTVFLSNSTTVSHSHYYTSVSLSHTCKMGIVMFMQDNRGVSVRLWSCVKLNMNKFQGSFSYFTACFEKTGRVMWNQFSVLALGSIHALFLEMINRPVACLQTGRRSLCHCGLSDMLWIIFGSIFVLVLRYFPDISIPLSCENACLMQKKKKSWGPSTKAGITVQGIKKTLINTERGRNTHVSGNLRMYL